MCSDITREIRRLTVVKPAADSRVAVMWDTCKEDVSFGNVHLSALGAGMDAGMLQGSQLCWVLWNAPMNTTFDIPLKSHDSLFI